MTGDAIAGLIAEIKARIPLADLAREASVVLKEEGNELVGLCPFHGERSPSFRIYRSPEDNEERYKCFGCGAGGDHIDFYEKSHSVSKATAIRELAERAGLEFPDHGRKPQGLPAAISVAEGDLERQVAALAKHPEVLSFLQEQRKLSPEIIQRARLGYDPGLRRVVIPLTNEAGKLLRTRLYDWQHKHPGAKVVWGGGTEKPKLYPAWALQEKELLLCAGEMDTLAAWSLGVPAITGTAGEKTWGKAYSSPFTGKRVTICYDVDEEGRAGAQLVAEQLAKVAAEVRLLILPLPWAQKGDPKDLTDWVVAGGTVDQLRELIAAAPIVPKPDSGATLESDAVRVVDRLPNAPVNAEAILPGRWLVSEKGIFQPSKLEDEPSFRQITATPVVITDRLRNLDTSTETFTIAFLREGIWHSIVAERDVLADKSRIVRLAARGLMVTSNTAGRMVQYLSDYETTNLGVIPERMVVSVSGWRPAPGGTGMLFVAGRQVLGGRDDG